jgi:hypothetical protein
MASESAYAGYSVQYANGNEVLWTNIGGLVGSPPGDYAQNKEFSGGSQNTGVAVFGQRYGFTLAEQQSVTGLEGGFWAYYASPGGGSGQLYVAMSLNGNPIGTGKHVTLTNEPQFYTLGSSTDLWGINPLSLWSTVQSSLFGLGVSATCSAPVNGTEVDIHVAWLPITVFHT